MGVQGPQGSLMQPRSGEDDAVSLAAPTIMARVSDRVRGSLLRFYINSPVQQYTNKIHLDFPEYFDILKEGRCFMNGENRATHYHRYKNMPR